jgi:hypothetical protein
MNSEEFLPEPSNRIPDGGVIDLTLDTSDAYKLIPDGGVIDLTHDT